MAAEPWGVLWPEVRAAIVARQPGGRLPRANGDGWIGPVHSPLRDDEHPSFSVLPDSATHPGGYVDHATGEKGSMADLAHLLGIQVGINGGHRPDPSEPVTLNGFAAHRCLDMGPLRRTWRVTVGTHKGRPCLLYPTPLGVARIKFLDGQKPKYTWESAGGAAHLYGLGEARRIGGEVLYVVNGEPAVWAASQAGVPAVCFCSGEGTPPTSELVADVAAVGFARVAVVYDNDEKGREGAPRVVAALRAGGVEAVALELPASVGEAGDVDDLHRQVGDRLGEALAGLPELRSHAVVEPRDAPLGRRAVPPWPDPLAQEAFHGPLGDLALTVAPHTEGDPAALLLQAIVSFGSLLGRVAYYQHEATRHGTNLFLAVVGQSSRGRKGTALDWVCRVLAMADATWASERVLSGLSSGEGVLWAVRDPIHKTEPVKAKGRATGELQTVLVDPGVDDKRLLVVEGELAQALKVLQREGNTLSPVLRRAWDDGNLRTLTKNSPAVASGAHVSLIGHVTAFELHALLAGADIHNGFANRVLWACARRSKLLPDGGDLQDAALVPIASALREAAESSRQIGRVERSRAAREVWHAVYPALTADQPGTLGAVTSRAEAQVLRLSLVYALADRSRVIDREHLLAAIAVWEYCAASAAHIFGDATGDRTADRIVDALSARPEGLTRDEIRDLFDRHKGARELDAALNLLASGGQVVCERRNTGGRPATVWLAAECVRARSAKSTKAPTDLSAHAAHTALVHHGE